MMSKPFYLPLRSPGQRLAVGGIICSVAIYLQVVTGALLDFPNEFWRIFTLLAGALILLAAFSIWSGLALIVHILWERSSRKVVVEIPIDYAGYLAVSLIAGVSSFAAGHRHSYWYELPPALALGAFPVIEGATHRFFTVAMNGLVYCYIFWSHGEISAFYVLQLPSAYGLLAFGALAHPLADLTLKSQWRIARRIAWAAKRLGRNRK